MGLLIAFAFWSLVAWVVFGWAKLPQAAQTWIPRVLLFTGLLGFAAAPFLQGRYSEEVALFIAGPNRYPVESIQRSFTFLSAGIGLAFLALYGLARWGYRLPWKSPLAQAFKFTLVMIILRVYFEKLGVPLSVATFFGIIWLIIPFAVYFGVEAAKVGSQKKFWGWLFSYAFGVRAFIIIVMLIATYFQLGTHFDNSSITIFSVFGKAQAVEAGSWEQYRNLILFPQLFLWTSVTLLAGLIFGWPSYLIVSRRRKF